MNFKSQKALFDPEKQKTDITIVGVGSTGSFVALTLAKMGFNNINIIDYDNVEEHNIPGQFYRVDDIGISKVGALTNIIKDFTGSNINFDECKIEDDYNFDLTANSLVIICVDTMEARQLIYELIKGYPVKIIDTRFGGDMYSVHVADLKNSEEKEAYEKSLGLVTKDTMCGEKGCIYTILSLASEVCNIAKMIDKDEGYPKLIKRDMNAYLFVAKN